MLTLSKKRNECKADMEKPRIEYLSNSKGKYLDIQDMNDHHLMNAIRKMVTDTKGAEFRIVHKNHAELAYVTSTITEVEVVTE